MSIQTGGSEAPASTETAETKAPARKARRKLPVALGIVLSAIVIAGAGFWVWHEQPSFCNAICHTPMAPYLPTYEAEPGETAVDKWGNEVVDAASMMAATHRVEAEADCMSCHVSTLSEQVSEGIAWVTGSYEVVENEAFGAVLTEKGLADLTAARGVDDEVFCLNESCHNMSVEDLAALTADMERNPHVAEHSTLACSDCHKAHRASFNACTQCHGDAETPEGWLTYDEQDQLTSA